MAHHLRDAVSRLVPLRTGFALLAILLLAVAPTVLAADAAGTGGRPLVTRGADVSFGAPVGTAPAARDTVYLIGGPGNLDGSFETAGGAPDWHGWTSVDHTAGEPLWQIATFHADNLGDPPHGAGNHAMWCGTTFPGGDPGYGNGWNAVLQWTGTAPDPGVATDVLLEGFLNHDTEPLWDQLFFQVNRGGVWTTLAEWDGAGQNVPLSLATTVAPDEYVGDVGDEIQLRWLFTSDGAWSDEDGWFDTDGACQLDDLRVSLDGAEATFDDFEPGSPVHWDEVLPAAVGDFAHLWGMLQDVDPCFTNTTIQVAFIDDGLVVPGTGGSMCITWCYGPGGYIVNCTGGLAGPESHLHNGVLSPVAEWPSGLDGATLAFDVYRHNEYAVNATGVFYGWDVRSTASADPADIATAAWRHYSWFQYGGPEYLRFESEITPLLENGRRWVQVQLRVDEFGWLWGLDGEDGTPAPYFDNVLLKAFPYNGPAIAAQSVDQAQDAFPQQGFLDLDDLASNSCRFDMAQNISPPEHLRNDPGDSVVLDVRAVREGAVLAGPPELHYRILANPVFDAVRIQAPDPDGCVVGVVAGDTCRVPGGAPIEGRWFFDLPDTGLLYPGDVVHYFVEATDDLAGDLQTARWPADTTGYHDFTFDEDPAVYTPDATMRCLPTVLSEGGGQPAVLLWVDDGTTDWDHWQSAMWHGYGYLPRHYRGYDVYLTRGATSGVGNGLGGRATAAVLDRYDAVLYTCGDLVAFTLGNGDFATDPSRDLQVLMEWLDAGNHSLLATGDNLVSSTALAGAAGQQFVSEYLGVGLVDPDVRPLIQNLAAPLIAALPGNPVFSGWEWVAYGGCPRINTFDAVTALAEAEPLAEFLDAGGNGGVFPYAAATDNRDTGLNRHVVSLPYALRFVYDSGGQPPPQGGIRAALIGDVFLAFSLPPPPPPDVPDLASGVQVSWAPNPFNPRTHVALSLPRAADVSVKLYDLRGALVRTLHRGRLAAGDHTLVWDGSDDRGRAAASGVYFAEVKALDRRSLTKLTMIK